MVIRATLDKTIQRCIAMAEQEQRRDSEGQVIKVPVKKRRNDSEGSVRHG